MKASYVAGALLALTVAALGLIPVGVVWANAIGAPLEGEVRAAWAITWIVLFVVGLFLAYLLDEMLD